jgi:preprotein translocase subunit YajC
MLKYLHEEVIFKMDGFAVNLGLLVILIALMYFTVVKPQKRMKKQREEMLAALKVGDKIVTIGGIYGKITALKEATMKLEVAPNVELKMQREAVSFPQEEEQK